MTQPVQTLVIPAAGEGTRLRPMTYVAPKEMLRLVDKPIAWYLLAEAYQAGIRRVIFITHKDNPFTKEFFESSRAAPLLADFPGLNVSFIKTDIRSGDGQAILLVKNILWAEPFAVSMGDIVTLPGTSILAELAAVYERIGEPIISVEEVPREKTAQYGVINPDEHMNNVYRVRSIVEKPLPAEAPSNLAMTGKYILKPSIFEYLEKLQGREGELKLAHVLDVYAREQVLNACVPHTKHYDTGTKAELFRTEIAFSLEHPELGDTARTILQEIK